MSLKEFGELLQSMREQCFHMSDNEATIIVDEFIKENPRLLNFQSREWLIQNT